MIVAVPDPASIKASLKQPENLNTPVWRYLSLARFLWLLLNRQLWLAPLDRLGDSFEGVAPSTLVHDLTLPTDLSSYGVDSTMNRAEALTRIRRSIFVSSWHLSEHESDTMWRAYCAGAVLFESVRWRGEPNFRELEPHSRMAQTAGWISTGSMSEANVARADRADKHCAGTCFLWCGPTVRFQQLAHYRVGP
jgi:hypothetical protein